MKKIFKYELAKNNFTTVNMPTDAEVLSVLGQGESVVVYALIDTDETNTYPQDFLVIGTGISLPETSMHNLYFMDTVSTHDEEYVWHVFIRE